MTVSAWVLSDRDIRPPRYISEEQPLFISSDIALPYLLVFTTGCAPQSRVLGQSLPIIGEVRTNPFNRR